MVNTEKTAELRVADVMHEDLILLQENQTLNEAAYVFEKFGISGAPVVDRNGACVGVLTASDFLSRERQLSDRHRCFGIGFDGIFVERPASYLKSNEDNLVREHMSRQVLAISRDASLSEAARVLCEHHVHRLVVLNEAGCPLGIISALDFVAMFSNAAAS